MKVINFNLNLRDFGAWSGAKDTQKRIIEENKEDDFERLIDELYPEGIEETRLNDLLWFESEWIYESLGIKSDDDEDEDENEGEEE